VKHCGPAKGESPRGNFEGEEVLAQKGVWDQNAGKKWKSTNRAEKKIGGTKRKHGVSPAKERII